MRTQLHHVAYVVPSLEGACNVFEDLSAGEIETFAAEGTREQYLGTAPPYVLLMEPTADGAYMRALHRRGAVIHHIGLQVEALDAFIDEVVEGSGWFLHPCSLRTRNDAGTVWLTRPNVEVLVEVSQADSFARLESCFDRIEIAGLDLRSGLRRIFDGCGVDVVDGLATAVVVGAERIWTTQSRPSAIIDPGEYNRAAWNAQVRGQNRWTVPVDSAEIQRAREGHFEVLLTPSKPVPKSWLEAVDGVDLLCLASGGGQQGPLFAAAGANVTVFDASEEQLAQDEFVASRDSLDLRTVRGDMRDLSAFDDGSFDLIFHPCSNSFVEEILPVWREAFRVLRPGGELLAGFSNPIANCFDWGSIERGSPRLRFSLPYRDLDHLDVPWVAKMLAADEPLEFGHTLADQLGGQTAAGFHIIDLFEDYWGDEELFPDAYFPCFIATRARKPS